MSKFPDNNSNQNVFAFLLKGATLTENSYWRENIPFEKRDNDFQLRVYMDSLNGLKAR